MNERTENLLLEHLKRIQHELAAAHDRDADILARLASIESALARVVRDGASNFAEIIQDRHLLERLQTRIERIERRLELADE